MEAHALLVASDPAAGSALDSAPTAIVLTFSERTEPSLTRIRLLSSDGVAITLGRATPVVGEPTSLTVSVPPLDDGVYTVTWRVVSRVDGHPTAGGFAFGIGITPDQAQAAAAAETTTTPRPGATEIGGRWFLLMGLVALVGSTLAGAAGFAGPRRETWLATGALALALIGLILLTVAQRSSAAVPLGEFLGTRTGRAVILRAITLAVAAIAVLVGRWTRSPATETAALWCATAATAATLAIHVAAGHAAAGTGWVRWATVGSQWSHFVAIGAWFGGLTALLVGVSGNPTVDKALAVRRFSIVAAAALAIVVVTGTVRALVALETWGDLVSSGYGRAVLAKLGILVVLVGLGLVNRARSVPVAATDLRPLRRVSRPELVLAVAAVGVTAVLTSLSPPIAATALGLTVEGSDELGTMRAELTTEWALAGPNTFRVRLSDAAGDPVVPDRVSLRFVPLDDPATAASTLVLSRGEADGLYVGAGQNLAFAGRWQVSVLAQESGMSRVVRLELDVGGPPQFLSVAEFPGEPVHYTVQLADQRLIRLYLEPSASGPDRFRVQLFNYASEPLPVTSAVLTATDREGVTRRLPLERLDASSFVATTDLVAGQTRFAVIARDERDVRLYGTFDIDLDRYTG